MIRTLVISTMAFMCITPVVLIVFDLVSTVTGGG
jgi:hypothetical protein